MKQSDDVYYDWIAVFKDNVVTIVCGYYGPEETANFLRKFNACQVISFTSKQSDANAEIQHWLKKHIKVLAVPDYFSFAKDRYSGAPDIGPQEIKLNTGEL